MSLLTKKPKISSETSAKELRSSTHQTLKFCTPNLRTKAFSKLSGFVRYGRSRSLERVSMLKQSFLRRKSCACKGCGGMKLVYRCNQIESKKSTIKTIVSSRAVQLIRSSLKKISIVFNSTLGNLNGNLLTKNSNAKNLKNMLYSQKPIVPNLMKYIQQPLLLPKLTTKGVVDALVARLYLSNIDKKQLNQPNKQKSIQKLENLQKPEKVDNHFKELKTVADFRIRKLTKSHQLYSLTTPSSFKSKSDSNLNLNPKRKPELSKRAKFDVLNRIYSPRNSTNRKKSQFN